MSIDIVQQLISSLGFPIFVTVWFMVKSSKEMKCMTEALNKIEYSLVKLSEGLNKANGKG